MVKYRKGNTVVLGLSKENIKRLQDNQPIKFNMNEMDFPDITFLIMTGETEHSIAAEISKMTGGISKDTVFKDSRQNEN